MKIYLNLIIIALVITACQQNQRNCAAYKTGMFTFNYVINGKKKVGKFMRTDSLSIDFFDTKTDSSSIRWINDCEFVSKKINPKSLAEKNALHYKILSTTDSSYTFEYKYVLKKANQANKAQKGVAYLVKQ